MRRGRLTVLHSPDDLACVDALGSEVLADTVVAFDLDVHLRLQERGIDHRTPWDFVGRGELPRLRRFEASVQDFWRRSARAVDGGVDLLALARFRHVGCFRRLAWAAYALRHALESFSPAEVVTFEVPSGHGLHQPAGYNRMPLLFALLRGMAERDGLAVRLLNRAVPFEDRAAADARRSLPAVNPSERLRGRDWVQIHGDGPDLLRQLPLVTSLRERGMAVVQTYSVASAAQLREASNVGHDVCHVSQLIEEAGPVQIDRARNQWRSAFDAARTDAPPELKDIFCNPHVDIHFDFIFGRYLEAMASHVRSWGRFYALHPPSLLITATSAPLIDMACRAGIPCLHLAHGLMTLGEPEYFTTLPGGVVGTISQRHRQSLIAHGLPATRARVTGDPSLDPALRHVDEAGAGATARTGDRDRPRVLLLSSSMALHSASNTLPGADWAESVRTIDRLGVMIGRHPEWAFSVKCHPRWDHPALWARLQARLPDGCRLARVDDTSLHDLMPAVDATVLVNAITSALVEASLWPGPVLILDTSLIWWDHQVWGTEAWPRIGSVPELELTLQSIFGDRRSRDRLARKTRAALEGFFGGAPQPAVPRCLDVIEELIGTPDPDSSGGVRAADRSVERVS